jgi:O-antigen ligase
MNNYKIIKIIDLLLGVLFAFLLLFVPLCFAFFLKTNNVFELNKLVLFKILVLIGFFLILIKVFINKQRISRTDIRTFAFSNNKSVWLVGGGLAVSFLLATFASENFEQSLYGSYDRQQGLVFFIYLLIYFLILVYFLREIDKLKKCLAIISLAAFFSSLYGIIQALGLDPFVWIESTKLRATSTFGQPNNFASFIIASLPAVVFLFFNAKGFLKKALFFMVFLVQLSALYFCFSVSAWLSLIIGVAVTLSLYLVAKFVLKTIISKDKKPKIRRWLVGLVLLLFSLPFFLNQQNPGMLSARLVNSINLQTGSTAARLQFWSAAWQGIKAKLWFGHGLETQEDVLVRYYKPEWALFSNVNVRPDRAHNIVLDILLTRGLLGLFTSLALMALILSLLWQNIKNKRFIFLNYLLFFYFAAYFVYLNFNFHNISTLIYFVFYLAVLLVVSKKDFSPDLTRESDEQISVKITRNKTVVIILFLLIGGTFLIWQINRQIKIVVNDSYLYQLKVAQADKSYFFALDLYYFLQEDRAHDRYYDRQFGLILSDWVNRFEGPFFEMGIEKIKMILPKINQGTYIDTLARARLNTVLARQDEQKFGEAEADFEKLLKISPEMPVIYREYAEMFLAKNDMDKAILYYQMALSKLPRLDDARMNSEHRRRVAMEMKWNYDGIVAAYKKKSDVKRVAEFTTLIEDLDL